MLPIIVAGSRPAVAGLAQSQHFDCDTSADLHRLRRASITETARSRVSFASTVLLNPIGCPTRTSQIAIEPAAPPHVSPPAISSFGGLRTPALKPLSSPPPPSPASIRKPSHYQKSASLSFLPPWRASERKAKRLRLTLYFPIQSGNPSFRRFSAIRFRAAGEKTIACLNFETVRSG